MKVSGNRGVEKVRELLVCERFAMIVGVYRGVRKERKFTGVVEVCNESACRPNLNDFLLFVATGEI